MLTLYERENSLEGKSLIYPTMVGGHKFRGDHLRGALTLLSLLPTPHSGLMLSVNISINFSGVLTEYSFIEHISISCLSKYGMKRGVQRVMQVLDR